MEIGLLDPGELQFGELELEKHEQRGSVRLWMIMGQMLAPRCCVVFGLFFLSLFFSTYCAFFFLLLRVNYHP